MPWQHVKNMKEYLFVYFKGEDTAEGEEIYFSKSLDGLFWKDMNFGKSVLKSKVGTKGVRDPYLVQNPKSGIYYLMATDLNIASGIKWAEAAQNGSKNIVVWESADLQNWSEPRLQPLGLKDSGCLWAPEAIFDRKKEMFFVYFSSWKKDDAKKDGKFRVYACYTYDFKTFTEPFVYIDRPYDVIDTTIVESDGRYYRISKNETTKKLVLEEGKTLTGNFCIKESKVLENLCNVEGPECYQLPDGRWCLIVDSYNNGKGYFPLVTETLDRGDFKALLNSEYDMGECKKRHGGVSVITNSI